MGKKRQINARRLRNLLNYFKNNCYLSHHEQKTIAININ